MREVTIVPFLSAQVGYQCPAVLENGKPCCGSVTATHHRQPLNQKKKQKRVQAAAAAAAAACPKPKLLASKRRVAAVTAAMRTGGEGRCLEVVATPGNVAIGKRTVVIVARMLRASFATLALSYLVRSLSLDLPVRCHACNLTFSPGMPWFAAMLAI